MAFVGRGKELARLAELGREAAAGDKRVVIVEGVAGSGKTALVERFADDCRANWKILQRSFIGSTTKGPMAELVGLAKELGAAEPPSEWTGFDEAFLLSKDGLLIHHGGASTGPGVDEDVLGSMLSAVQDFVRDSFGDKDRSGGLNQLAYKDLQILIEHGKQTFIACVVSRGVHPSMRGAIVDAIGKVEGKYGEKLSNWDGDISALVDVPSIVSGLVGRRFPRVSLSGEEAVAHQNLMFEWFRKAINDRPTRQPCLVMLEDLQEAERTSLQALNYALRGLSEQALMVVITRRTGEGEKHHEDFSMKLVEDGHAEMLQIGGMTDAEVKELMSEPLRGAEVSDGLATEISSIARGIPSEVLSLVSSLRKGGRLVSEGGIWAIRGRRTDWLGGAAEASSKILEDLDPDTLSLLEFMSLISWRSDIDIVAIGLGWDINRLNGRLDYAREQNLVVPVPSIGYAFKSSHLEEALRSGMGPIRMAMWHRMGARALLTLKESGREPPVFAVAEHLAKGHEPEPGIEYCLRAAEVSEAWYAFPEAVKYLGWAVELMERLGGDARYTETIMHFADVLDLDGDFSNEIAALQKLATVAEMDVGMRADIHRKIGRAHHLLGDIAKAQESFESALAALPKDGCALERARIGNDIAAMLTKSSPEKALPLHEEYLRAANSSRSNHDLAKSLKAMGGINFHMRKVDVAIDYWQKAVAAYDLVSDSYGRSDVIVNLGAAYSVVGRMEDSIRYLEEAVAQKEKLGDFRRLAQALANLGIAYNRGGNYDLAVSCLKRSLEIRIRLDDPMGIASSYNSLGGIFWQTGKYEEAIEYNRKELRIMLKRGDARGTAQTHSHIGESLAEIGKYGEAEEHADLALVISKKNNYRDLQVTALTTKGRVASGKGNWKDACDFFDAAVMLAIGVNEPRKLGITYLAYGEEGLNHRDPQASKHLEMALELLTKAGAAPLAEKAQKLLNQHATAKVPPAQ